MPRFTSDPERSESRIWVGVYDIADLTRDLCGTANELRSAGFELFQVIDRLVLPADLDPNRTFDRGNLWRRGSRIYIPSQATLPVRWRGETLGEIAISEMIYGFDAASPQPYFSDFTFTGKAS